MKFILLLSLALSAPSFASTIQCNGISDVYNTECDTFQEVIMEATVTKSGLQKLKIGLREKLMNQNYGSGPAWIYTIADFLVPGERYRYNVPDPRYSAEEYNGFVLATSARSGSYQGTYLIFPKNASTQKQFQAVVYRPGTDLPSIILNCNTVK